MHHLMYCHGLWVFGCIIRCTARVYGSLVASSDVQPGPMGVGLHHLMYSHGLGVLGESSNVQSGPRGVGLHHRMYRHVLGVLVCTL